MNKKISRRMIASILPIVVIAFVAVALFAAKYARKELEEATLETMMISMDAAEYNISSVLSEPETITRTIADIIGRNERYGANLSTYENAISKYILENDCIIAMGFFMEPLLWRYNENDGTYKNMFNYYWTQDGDTVSFVDIGQNADLTGTDWYVTLKENGGVYYTETYVDTTIGILMTSYVVPVYDNFGNFIGCVNTDIDMSKVQEITDSIKVGETGHCMLATKSKGLFVSGVENDQLLNEEFTLLTDESSGFAKHGEAILANPTYQCRINGTYGSNVVYTNHFDTYDWILLTLVSSDEINAPAFKIVKVVAILSVIAIIVSAFVIARFANRMSKTMVNVKDMAENMSEGDYTMEPLKVTGKDELAGMTTALNKMLENNRSEMTDIANNANIISEGSNTLKAAVGELEASFNTISDAISQINNAMMDNNATTEQLNASVNEVMSSVDNLANKAKESESMSREIMDRAKGINKESTESFDKAMALTKQYEIELNESIENSKVVEEIGIMADAINDIAEQINLLSLNASIEAARAGEAGKGFAVVASEIGNLAAQTSKTVASIQDTIIKVREAVSTLADNSGKIITFINESVTPDYKNFVDVSVKYEQDAIEIKALAEYVSQIANTLSGTMEEFDNAIENIAEMSQQTTEKAADVLSSVDIVADNVGNVDDISKGQIDIAAKLDTVVSRYKL